MDEKSLPCAFVDWDNTPRRGKAGRVTVGSTPEKFRDYLIKLISKTKNEYKKEYLFVIAWNEWAEGSYLEPDEDYKYGYLEALREAVDNS